MKTRFKKSVIRFHALCLVLTMVFSACKKDSDTTPAAAGFPKNTEWVGTLNGSGFQYRPPCSLKFNSDNTFTIYAIFVFFPNGVETRQDSLSGTIQKMDTLPDMTLRITTEITTGFNTGATRYIYISDKERITATNADNSLETFQLVVFPEKVPAAGQWSGPAWKGSLAYPDLSSIQFDDSNPAIPVTHYIRNGKAVQEDAQPTSKALGVTYVQKGARVYFSGWSEVNPAPGYGGWAIPYFGVLTPSGDQMMVDSRSDKARLPNYVYTSEPYGPNGSTPVISRK